MKIDWFTVVAQAINFLVLLWLMKRFLYKPILHAIDEREKRIAEELANAETEKSAAKKQKEEYDRKHEDLEGQRAAFLKNAEDEAQAEKLRLLKKARDAADELSTKRRESMVEEERISRQAIRRRTQVEVLAITKKVLADLAGSSLEEQVVGVFNQRLRDLDEAEINSLASALKTRPNPVAVRTALDISPELRTATEASIKEIVGSQTKVTFESDPELISGIELSVNGHKIAWSVADYLSSIKEGFDDLLNERGEAEKLDPEEKGQ